METALWICAILCALVLIALAVLFAVGKVMERAGTKKWQAERTMRIERDGIIALGWIVLANQKFTISQTL